MKEIHLDESCFHDEVMSVFNSDFPVVIFEFSGVYGLISPNSIYGAKALDKVKNRLPDKYYGSFLGTDDSFFATTYSCEQINCKELISLFEGAFVRVPVRYKERDISVIYQGRHQFLVENSRVRNKISAIELELQKTHDSSDFFTYNYQSPLCTSANESGDKSGGILEKSIALDFAHKKNIALFVHTDLLTNNTGSYPVFQYENNQIEILRNGPNDLKILDQIKRRMLENKRLNNIL